MPSIQAQQLGDLVASTIRDLGEPNLTEIATDIQDHVAMSRLLKESNIKKYGSGTGLQWDVMVNHSGSFRNVGLYQRDQTNQVDVLVQAQADWRHCTTNWSMDDREIAMNRGQRRIVDLMKVRRLAAMISYAEGEEANFWRFPSATDDVTPLGLPYWVTKNATEGFNGGTPTGYTTVGNLSPSTYSRWNNWTFPYTLVTIDDFGLKLRTAMKKCVFKPPVDGIPTFNTGDKWGLYTTLSVQQSLENMVTAQNENVGNDLAYYDYNVYYRKAPVVWVPYLDPDTTGPIYGINWGVYKVAALLGRWMAQYTIPMVADQHNVTRNHIDWSRQFICYNRRACFVGSNGTTYPS